MAKRGPKKRIADPSVAKPYSKLGRIEFTPLDQDPPEYLTPDAKIEWNRLRSTGVLQILHVAQKASVEIYCTAYGHYKSAERAMATVPIETSTTLGRILKQWMDMAKVHGQALGLYAISAPPKSRHDPKSPLPEQAEGVGHNSLVEELLALDEAEESAALEVVAHD